MLLLILIGSLALCVPPMVLAENYVDNTTNTDISTIFIILSQPNKHHQGIAKNLRDDITSQLQALRANHSSVFVAPTDFGDLQGYWTLFPLMEKFVKFDNFSWIFFIEEHTSISVFQTFQLLRKHYGLKTDFIGYALKDHLPTIIHHFDDPAISTHYPHMSAGIALSRYTVLKSVSRWIELRKMGLDFSIDAKYEFAKFLFDECEGIQILHEDYLCLAKKHRDCATWVTKIFPDCGRTVKKENVFFAVKTCKKFHNDRVPVVKNTWIGLTNRAIFFSDVDDPIVPTVSVGVENVSHGHCEKTMTILKYFRDHHRPNEKWLVISDDDTIFSVTRMFRILSCYNHSDTIALGERYGYGNVADHGYDYITGGAGMVFSLPTVNLLVAECPCPTIFSPDDMVIGMCLKNLNIPIIHAPNFHQARPWDYHEEYLSSYLPISFHKYWKIDPLFVYKSYLLEPHEIHSEL